MLHEDANECVIDIRTRGSTPRDQSVIKFKSDLMAMEGKIELNPRRAWLGFDRETAFPFSRVVPSSSNKTATVKMDISGSFSYNYDSSIVSSVTLVLDLQFVEYIVGGKFAVLFVAFSVDPCRNYTIDSDWSVTVDVSTLFAQSKVLYTRLLGQGDGGIVTYMFKIIGELFDSSLGKIQIGFKLFGQTTSDSEDNSFIADLTGTLTQYNITGEIYGDPLFD